MRSTMHCRTCARDLSDQAIACPGCGMDPLSGTKHCQHCGGTTEPGQRMCTSCGAPLATPAARRGVGGTGEKSRLVAGLLGIFLGGLGVHRFYLGYTTIGIVQIVVTIVTFGIGALWGFIEGILLLVGSMDRDANDRALTWP